MTATPRERHMPSNRVRPFPKPGPTLRRPNLQPVDDQSF